MSWDASGLLVTCILAVILGLTYFTQISRVFLFWVAFILTRPFGATFGDILTKTPEKGGLDFGRGYSSLILLAILVITILVSKKVKNGQVIEPAPSFYGS